MAEKDFEIVCSKIEEERVFLNTVSQNIWKMPETQFREVHAHATLTCALRRHGFKVQKHYFIPTAFKAEYSSKAGPGPTIAILLEYDALPDIGHACGHNLIAEAGLAAALGVKAAMEVDRTVLGKLLILGTPAEEDDGGKIRLLELGAFDDVDVALMVHPAKYSCFFPLTLCNAKYSIEFKGQEAQATSFPWGGRNALDAAVACYQSLAQLRQHIKPTSRINAIITKGGTAANLIPTETSMVVEARSKTKGDLQNLLSKVERCIKGAATATGCDVQYRYDKANTYENMITNKILGDTFKNYATDLGMSTESNDNKGIAFVSSDMGNVSHVVPSIHPLYAIETEGHNHTKEFTKASGSQSAQEPTLLVGKAMALTALKVLRCPKTMEDVKKQFRDDINEDMQC